MALAAEESDTAEAPPQETLRDSLEAAFDQHESESPTDEKKDTPPPEQSEEAPVGEAAIRAARERDPNGRFRPKVGDQPQAAPSSDPVTQDKVGEQAAPTPEQAAAAAKLAAPSSWTPAERANWKAVPTPAREAIMRREAEIGRSLQESATSRRAVESMQQVVSPYLQNIRAANGGDVVGAMRQFFEYDNKLRHGTQLEKAQAITTLIKGYGIDIATLDNTLAGAAPSPQDAQQSAAAQQAAAVQRLLQQELAPFRQMMAAQQQETVGRVNQTIEQFATDPAHQYFTDVQGPMADIMEMAERQGKPMSLKDAYDSACWQNPEIRSILLKDVASRSARTDGQAAQRARAAAVGVKSGPRATLPSAADEAGRSRLDDVAAAFDKVANAQQ